MMLFAPAIYEYKAALIGRSVREVADSAELLAQALEAEYSRIKPDFLTVGVDIYNLEAEALGAARRPAAADECPELTGPLWDLHALPADLALPVIPAAGRFGVMLKAAELFRRKFPAAPLRVAATGPLTLAAKLTGIEDLLLAWFDEDPAADRLLNFTLEVVLSWSRCLRENGFEVIGFDSMAAPPIVSPEFYRTRVLPLHRCWMTELAASGQQQRELVIGGDTTPIGGALADSGANLLLCDFPADPAAFRTALGDDRHLSIRRNLNPARITIAANAELVRELRQDCECFSRPIAGTGILPYHFPLADLLDLQEKLGKII